MLVTSKVVGMETLPIYKDFDLPTKHLVSEEHFVPPKARDEEEIERRRALPTGTLLAEHQEVGLAMASTILKRVSRPEDVRFSSRILSASGLNTAWYSFARGAENEVMRRRLKLPYLAAYAPEFRQTSDEILYDAAYYFTEAKNSAVNLRDALELRHGRKIDQYRRSLGRNVGKASLTLACVSLGSEITSYLPSADIQLLVRKQSLGALNDARCLDGTIGLPPSIAQLADPDSHLSVYWRRESPNGAKQAYEAAVDLHI